jgi:hypothetical protein
MAGLRRAFASLLTGLELPILHPRENPRKTGSISTVGGEIFFDGLDGCNSISVDVRGVYTLMTFELQGTSNGADWFTVPLTLKDPNQLKTLISSIPTAAVGAWEGDISGYSVVRLRNTSGSAPTGNPTIVMIGSNAPLSRTVVRDATFRCPTTTAVVGALTALTLAAPGVGLRHYITKIQVDRINGTAAALTPSTAVLNITTSNIPDALAFSVPQDALAPGAMSTPVDKDFGARPLAASSQNSNTTITCPATPGIIWRVTAYYFVAP